MKKILGFIVLVLCFSSPSYSEEYKMPNIQPKDLVNDGYILHSIFKINELLNYWKKIRLITLDTYLIVTQFLMSQKNN